MEYKPQNKHRRTPRGLDARIEKYVASATGAGAVFAAGSASGAIVANTTPQPFGINESVDIDFNADGIVDFQIDHDRVNLNGNDLDYLQLDKNDASSAENPLPINPFNTFGNVPHSTYDGDFSWDGNDITEWANGFGTITNPGEDTAQTDGDLDRDTDLFDLMIAQRAFGVEHNYDHGYYAPCGGCHPSALTSGTSIGPFDLFDFSESDDAFGLGNTLRANRLIDEDNGQIDLDAGDTVEFQQDAPQFTGLGGAERFLGVRIDLNDALFPDNLFATANGPGSTDDPSNYHYGWIGIQITNEADATGVVTGYAYETTPGTAILAGDTGAVPVNAVPEPCSLVVGALGGLTLTSSWLGRRLFRR